MKKNKKHTFILCRNKVELKNIKKVLRAIRENILTGLFLSGQDSSSRSCAIREKTL